MRAGVQGGDALTKILVVDDAAFMRLKCSKLLSSNGYDVVEAGNGVEAVDVYRREKPDAGLMDVTMPEMDGLTALKEIRTLDPSARIAMVTAMGQQSVVMEAIKSGARDFVVKPFEPTRVMAALKKLLA